MNWGSHVYNSLFFGLLGLCGALRGRGFDREGL